MKRFSTPIISILAGILFLGLVGNNVSALCNDKLDMVFVLDVSGTMIEPCGSTDKITCLKDATKEIIDSPKMANSRISIFTFTSYTQRIANLTDVSGNEALLKGYVTPLEPLYTTAMGDALQQALEYINTSKAPQRKGIVILFTDGMVNDGNLSTSKLVDDYVSDNWKDGPIEIYTVGTGNDVDRHMLKRIAAYTHGKFYQADTDCDGTCIADLFLEAMGYSKWGFKVSYLFTSCDEMLNKKIIFDACATNVSDYAPSDRKITNISIVDTLNKNLSYVPGSGVISYVNKTSRTETYQDPTEYVLGNRRILTFNTSNLTENASIILDFGIMNNTGNLESISGSKNNATTYYTIDNVTYNVSDNVTFTFFCGCPPTASCDGTQVENNGNCEQDQDVCDTTKDISGALIKRLGHRDQFGNCTAKPACYCIEDPWSWITDPDFSAEACNCIAGQDMWDPDNGKCCNANDCWDSKDKTWVCENGQKKQGTDLCEKLESCGKEQYWNMSAWTEKIPDGCTCDVSESCTSGICLTGKCLTPENPNISFTSETIALKLGSNTQIVIHVKNNLAIKDTINVKLYTYPEILMNWMKFKNGENEIAVNLEGYEEESIVLDIFAGKTGAYKVKIVANSMVSPNLYATDEQYVEITHLENGIKTNTPDIQWIAVFIIIFIAVAIASDRYVKKGSDPKKKAAQARHLKR